MPRTGDKAAPENVGAGREGLLPQPVSLHNPGLSVGGTGSLGGSRTGAWDQPHIPVPRAKGRADPPPRPPPGAPSPRALQRRPLPLQPSPHCGAPPLPPPLAPHTPQSLTPTGPGAGGLSLYLFPVTTRGSAPPGAGQPGGAVWGHCLRIWGYPGPHQERKALPVEPSARALGLPTQMPGCCSPTGTPPSSGTPHVAPPATLRSQPPCHAHGGPGGNPRAHPGCCPVPSTGLLVRRTKARRPPQNREKLKAAASEACCPQPGGRTQGLSQPGAGVAATQQTWARNCVHVSPEMFSRENT